MVDGTSNWSLLTLNCCPDLFACHFNPSFDARALCKTVIVSFNIEACEVYHLPLCHQTRLLYVHASFPSHPSNCNANAMNQHALVPHLFRLIVRIWWMGSSLGTVQPFNTKKTTS